MRHSGTLLLTFVTQRYANNNINSYVFQEETGENETPHLQGFIHYKQPVALSTIKAWNPRIHWEQTRSIVQSVAYCSDEEKRKQGGRIWTHGYAIPSAQRVDLLTVADMFTWQRELAAELETPPDPRKIIWYYDRVGGSGKTEMAKYVLGTCDSALFLSGGSFKDISFQVIKAKKDPTIVVINLPRTSDGKVSYASLEACKDGLVQSGKYEGGVRMFPNPHVVVMANFEPDYNALSNDRWEVRHLDNNRRIE